MRQRLYARSHTLNWVVTLVWAIAQLNTALSLSTPKDSQMMRQRKPLQPLLEEALLLNSRICLKLPATALSIQRQVAQLQRSQQQISQLKQRITLLAAKAFNPSVRHLCRLLLQILERLQTTASNLLLLAEEFGFDPEGTISCLHSLKQRDADLLPALMRLHEILNPPIEPEPILSLNGMATNQMNCFSES